MLNRFRIHLLILELKSNTKQPIHIDLNFGGKPMKLFNVKWEFTFQKFSRKEALLNHNMRLLT